MVAEAYDYVIDIDTHSRTHTYAVINTATGAMTGCEAFHAMSNGMNRAIARIRCNSRGNTLAAVEGTNSYGSPIRRIFTDEKICVVEVKPPRKKVRNGIGKTDQIEATAAAMSVRGEDIDTLFHPRCDGARVAISVLLAARLCVEQKSTANRNALNSVVRQLYLRIDARTALSDKQAIIICNWRIREQHTVEQHIDRGETMDLAKEIQRSQNRMEEIREDLSALAELLAMGMQN